MRGPQRRHVMVQPTVHAVCPPPSSTTANALRLAPGLECPGNSTVLGPGAGRTFISGRFVLLAPEGARRARMGLKVRGPLAGLITTPGDSLKQLLFPMPPLRSVNPGLVGRNSSTFTGHCDFLSNTSAHCCGQQELSQDKNSVRVSTASPAGSHRLTGCVH